MEGDNIVIVDCYRFWSDWTDNESVRINLDDYVFFELDYRGESWHIIGHKTINDKWVSESLSVHGVCGNNTLVNFIKKANSYNKYQKCKVSRINNLHYSCGFYKNLLKLLTAIESEVSND